MPKPTDAKKVLEMLYGAPKPAVSRLDMNFKDVTKRMPELQQAAKLYEQGKITREQYYAIVDQLKPVTPYEFIPKPATAEEALAALSKDKVKDFGRTDVLTPGETILSRLDIPSYSQKGTWVTSQHRLKPPADEPKTIYTPTMMLEGETKMLPGTKAARKVAKGEENKSSFATIRGAYKPGSDEEAVERAIEALRSKDYAQIGYDPERRGFFYDRRTMEPIIGTEEGIIQIGPLVLGKKPVRGNPEDFEYKEGGAVHMQDGGDPTQMFNFNPMAAKAAKQKQMRESTPETPLGALSRGFASGLFGNIEDPVPYTGSIMEGSPQRQQSQANLREIGRNVGALTDIGGMVTPFAKPATQAITRGATALGRTGLEQVDRAMFGEGPLASLVAPVAPLQAVPRVQAPVSRLGFYDPVEQAGLNIQRKQGPGQAFLNELQRSENVSKDFLEASGIAEKLRTAPNITRDEVQAMTKGAVPEVQEVVLGSNVIPPSVTEFAKVHLPDFNPSNKDSIAKLIQVADQRYQRAMAEGDLDIAEFAEQAETEAKKLASQYESGSKPAGRLSKYAEYQLPGGNNYREVLLTVPSKRPSIKNMSRAEYNAAIEEADRLGIQNYQSSHWDEPNVVSHIRMNDRTDFNGKKVLFIEEMQSDWAQEGRKKGFADKPLTRDDLVATVNNSADRPYWEVRTKDGRFIANTGLGDKEISAQEAVDEALQLVKTRGDKRIPTGPFVKNTNEWVDLSLKSILKRAVDEGYDRVAFINGKQSADRYDLANYVDNIHWDSNPQSIMPKDAEKVAALFMKDYGVIELPISSKGIIVSAKNRQFNGKRLDEVVGRDVANKIMAGESGSLEGEGLSIGGEGMKKFYDQIVPDRLRKLVGKDNVKHIPGAVRHYGDADDYEIRVNRGGNSYYLYNTVTGDSLDESFNNLSDAHNFLEKLNQRNPALPQLGFDITPEIREKFSKPIPYKKGGAVRISDNPDTMLLELMNAPKMQAGGKLPPGIKRATERAKESKSVLPVAGARQARQAIQGYLGMDPSFSVMDPEAQALESAYRGGETASVLGDLFASLTPFATASALSKANQVPGLAELIAYHGSPHKFKKFDASKIGTGEGAQAYGHGLYFAESPDVAKTYQPRSPQYEQKLLKKYNAAEARRDYTTMEILEDAMMHRSPEEILQRFTNISEGYTPAHAKAAKDFASWYAKNLPEVGGMYKVDIPDEKIAQMLDWDKPLSQQPAAMQVARKVFNDPQRKSAGFPSITDEEIGNLTGQDLYQAMTTTRGGLQPGASKSLLQEGIPGIQYLDQASRDAKQGTRNFVVFPGEEQNIKMLDINGEPQMAAGGAALKSFRDKLLAQHQRSLAKDPRFKQAPGEVTNLAGKSYAQWAAEQQYKHELEDALARLSGVPEKKMSIQDLPVGSRLVSIIGDRTQADKILRSVNETPLANEVILHGGPRFGQGKLAQGKEDFWASQVQAAQGVQNRIDAAAERAKGKPVIGVYTAMSAKDSDMYAKHFAESLIEQYPFTGMTGKQVDAFNKEFRKKYPQFAGVDNPEFVDQIMANTEMRKAFVNEHLKKKNIEKFNIPDGLATRHAITVPELRDVPTGLAGYSVGEMKPGMALEKGSYLEHPTYNTVIPGRYMGGLEIMHDYRDLFPEATQRMRQTLRNNPKFQGPGARDPESQMFGTFGFQGAEQEVTQKLIDELAAREELIKQLGILPYKKGGKVKKVKISNNPDAMQLELMRKKKHA